MRQQTIQHGFSLSGTGLHSGKSVTMTFEPAVANHGIKFKRTDLQGQPVVPALAEQVTNTHRSTTLQHKDAAVTMVEHTLAALMGMSIDNVLISVDAEELPVLDGSARPIVDALRAAGTTQLDADREYIEIEEPLTCTDPATGATITIIPHPHMEVVAMIDFDSPVLGKQYAQLTDIAAFAEEIAPCRTFAFLHEVETLLDQGLIKGGNLDNAIVIANRSMTADELASLARKMGRESINVAAGILNTTQLRTANEPAGHKLLDLVGDLALCGKPFRGKVIATKPGHAINTLMAAQLRKLYQKQRKTKGFPKYDPTKPPLKTLEEIEKILPHRFPFLLVDKIIELSPTHVVGVKNVTYTEFFFEGHFPGNPVMPGVLQVEALAQTGGILALSTVPDPGNWDTYFLKIENTKFKQKVVPGDTVILKMELLSPIRRGICHMQGTAYVGDKIVSEGELTAQIVRRNTE